MPDVADTYGIKGGYSGLILVARLAAWQDNHDSVSEGACYRTGKGSWAMDRVMWLAWVGWMAASPLTAGPTLQKTVIGHSGIVYSVAFRPDGKILASADENGTIKLWDAVTGKNVTTLITPKAAVNPDEKVSIRSLAFSPDGRTLASGNTGSTSSGMIRLWHLNGGKDPAKFSGSNESWHTGSSGIYSVVFSPDGKTLASGHEDNVIRIWNAASGKISTTFEADGDDCIYSVAFSHRGGILASGGRGGTIKLWDVASAKITATFDAVGAGNGVYSLDFSPGDRCLAAGCWLDGGGMLWDVANGKNTAKFEPDPADSIAAANPNDMTYSVAISPDGKTFASGCCNGIIGLWDIPTGKKIAILHGHTALVRSLAFHPDGKTLASGSDDSTVRLWSLKQSQE